MGTIRVREPNSHIRATVFEAALACIAAGWDEDNEELVGNSLLNVLSEKGKHYERTPENVKEAAAVVYCVWDTNAELVSYGENTFHGNVLFDVEGPFEGPDGPQPNPMDALIWDDDGKAKLDPDFKRDLN